MRTFPNLAPTKPWPFLGMAWDVTKTPEFKSDVQVADTGREARRARWVTPVWHFVCHWNVLRDDLGVSRNAAKTGRKQELEKLLSFFLEGLGGWEPFWFKDPTDKRVTNQTIYASAPGGVTDFQLVRAFGNGGFVEPVGGLIVGDPQEPANEIRVAGVATTQYQANVPLPGWIRFNTAPTAGQAITGDYSYFFTLRFKDDKANFRTFAKDLWELQKVELVSAR